MLGHYQDIVYMRFMKQEEVVRVARADTHKGLVLALYPIENKDIFLTEAFTNIDDDYEKEKIQRNKINDDIWFRLLNNESHETIEVDYEAGSYCKKGASCKEVLHSRSFRIAGDSEED